MHGFGKKKGIQWRDESLWKVDDELMVRVIN